MNKVLASIWFCLVLCAGSFLSPAQKIVSKESTLATVNGGHTEYLVNENIQNKNYIFETFVVFVALGGAVFILFVFSKEGENPFK